MTNIENKNYRESYIEEYIKSIPVIDIINEIKTKSNNINVNDEGVGFIEIKMNQVLLLQKIRKLLEQEKHIDNILSLIKSDLEIFNKETKYQIINSTIDFYLRKKHIDIITSDSDMYCDKGIIKFLKENYANIDYNEGRDIGIGKGFKLRTTQGAMMFLIDDPIVFDRLYDSGKSESNTLGFKSFVSKNDILKGGFAFLNYSKEFFDSSGRYGVIGSIKNEKEAIDHEWKHTENDIIFRRKYIKNKEVVVDDNENIRIKDEIIAYLYDGTDINGLSNHLICGYSYNLTGEKLKQHKININKYVNYARDLKEKFPLDYLDILSVTGVDKWEELLKQSSEISDFYKKIEVKNEKIVFKEIDNIFKDILNKIQVYSTAMYNDTPIGHISEFKWIHFDKIIPSVRELTEKYNILSLNIVIEQLFVQNTHIALRDLLDQLKIIGKNDLNLINKIVEEL